MNKLYTLQECFEQAGKKFPFTITFHYYDNPKQITFINKKIDQEYADGIWIPEDSLNTHTTTDYEKNCCIIDHVGWAMEKLYEYKSCNFNKDMLELLD